MVGIVVAIALAFGFALSPGLAFSAEPVQGVGGPEKHKPPAVLVVIPKLTAEKKERTKTDVSASAKTKLKVPKGMLRPGPGPFPNVPRTDAEGTTPKQ